MSLQAGSGNVRGTNLPWHSLARNRIEIRNSPKTGRHFVATSDIAANTTILQERPYSVSMEKSVYGESPFDVLTYFFQLKQFHVRRLEMCQLLPRAVPALLPLQGLYSGRVL